MFIVVVVESSTELSFASSSQDSDEVIVVESFLGDFLVKQLGFGSREHHVDVVSFVPEGADQRKQELAEVTGSVLSNVFLEGFLVTSLVSLLYLEKLDGGPSASDLDENPVVLGEHFGGFFGQVSVSLRWIERPQHHSSLLPTKKKRKVNIIY